jgi:DNA-binding NarL/FixJ family response regulator
MIRVAVSPDSLDDEDEADVIVTSASLALRHGFAHQDFASRLDLELIDAPQAAILLLGDDRVNVQEMKRLTRAWGILPADSSADELTAAIHALSQGLIVGTPALLFESENEPLERGPLTERESEVLNLLAEGLANKQIAAALGISEHTVKFHVSSIYQKLNVTNRTEAVREGLRGGWIAL